MKSSRLDLLSPEREYNQRWLTYLQEFGGDDDLVFVCQGSPQRLPRVVAEVARRVSEETALEIPLWQIEPANWSGPQSLPQEQLQAVLNRVTHFRIDSTAAWAEITAAAELQKRGGEQAADTELRVFSSELAAALRSGSSTWSPFDLQLTAPHRQLLTNTPGDQAIVLARLRRDGNGGFVGGRDVFSRLEAIATETMALFLKESEADGTEAPDPLTENVPVRVGFTGMPVLEFDEMTASKNDSIQASVVSLVLVAALFVLAFGQLRLPLAAVACLGLGLAWTMGYITLSIGHLNLLSVAFGAILVGLGIDFTIHLAVAFQAAQSEYHTTAEALEKAIGRTGLGILTGGLTSALAFATAAWTPFRGVAELGLITSAGLLLCLVGTLAVFPAMLCLIFGSSPTATAPPIGQAILPLGRLTNSLLGRSRVVLALSLALTLVAAMQLPDLKYDHNLLHLQPANVASVHWENELIQRSKRSVWFAVSYTDSPEQLLQRKQQLLAMPEVETVTELTSPFVFTDEHRQLVQELQEVLRFLPQEAVGVAFPPQSNWSQLKQAIHQTLEGTGDAEDIRSLQDLQGTMQKLEVQGGNSESVRRLATLEAAWRNRLWGELSQVKKLTAGEATTPADLPPELRQRFYGRNGKQLLQIYPRGDIWDISQLEKFVRAVESVDAGATGHPIQTYYASIEMQTSYIHAAIYAAIAVLIVLYLDFRSLAVCALAMLPMLLGIVQCFGLMAGFGIPLNAANMIVLPLILGIGIDDGVHVIHDFLRQSKSATPGEPKQRFRLTDATATAITITSATTMAGFGSMMLADHRGLRSLGQVLTIGIFCCWFCSLFVLPAILKVRTLK